MSLFELKSTRYLRNKILFNSDLSLKLQIGVYWGPICARLRSSPSHKLHKPGQDLPGNWCKTCHLAVKLRCKGIMTAILRLKPDLLRRVISVFDVYQRSNSVKSEKYRHSNKNQSPPLSPARVPLHMQMSLFGWSVAPPLPRVRSDKLYDCI